LKRGLVIIVFLLVVSLIGNFVLAEQLRERSKLADYQLKEGLMLAMVRTFGTSEEELKKDEGKYQTYLEIISSISYARSVAPLTSNKKTRGALGASLHLLHKRMVQIPYRENTIKIYESEIIPYLNEIYKNPSNAQAITDLTNLLMRIKPKGTN
jgi:hypothetical protein